MKLSHSEGAEVLKVILPTRPICGF